MPESPRKLSYQQRARSLPHKYYYRLSLNWVILFYFILVCIIAAAFGFAFDSSIENAYLLLALVVSAVPVWLIGFLVRRKASCPLCKGTPFLDSRASKHVKALRLAPLNYGTTNLLRALITRRFRCHFCGTPFDMLKTNITLQAGEIEDQNKNQNP